MQVQDLLEQDGWDAPIQRRPRQKIKIDPLAPVEAVFRKPSKSKKRSRARQENDATSELSDGNASDGRVAQAQPEDVTVTDQSRHVE